MLNRYQNIREQYQSGEQQFSEGINRTSAIIDEMKEQTERNLEDIKNINVIISDIDKSFQEKTGILNPKDMSFLWVAVAMQCVRWIMLPTLDKETLYPDVTTRKDSSIEGKKDPVGTASQLNKIRKEREGQSYPDNVAIMALPVPYDAMKGTADIEIPGVSALGKNLCGTNHHAATLGHDPIIGQVIGTSNIMTRTITFNDGLLTTREVENPSGRTQIVSQLPYDIKHMIEGVIESTKEDYIRISTALTKENLHLLSDKNTKKGLPIPLLPAKLQQQLLKDNWNSKELENVIKGAGKGVGANLAVNAIINTIVGTLHGFCYNENDDDNRRLYGARTSKIVCTSNIIAESINLGAVAGGTISGYLSANEELIKKSITHLDIGGMIAAIHQISKNKALQEEIRREFLEQSLFERFTENKYSFLEEAHYEQS